MHGSLWRTSASLDEAWKRKTATSLLASLTEARCQRWVLCRTYVNSMLHCCMQAACSKWYWVRQFSICLFTVLPRVLLFAPSSDIRYTMADSVLRTRWQVSVNWLCGTNINAKNWWTRVGPHSPIPAPSPCRPAAVPFLQSMPQTFCISCCSLIHLQSVCSNVTSHMEILRHFLENVKVNGNWPSARFGFWKFGPCLQREVSGTVQCPFSFMIP